MPSYVQSYLPVCHMHNLYNYIYSTDMRMIIQIIVRIVLTTPHCTEIYTRYGYRVPTWWDADLEGSIPSKGLACSIENRFVHLNRDQMSRWQYHVHWSKLWAALKTFSSLNMLWWSTLQSAAVSWSVKRVNFAVVLEPKNAGRKINARLRALTKCTSLNNSKDTTILLLIPAFFPWSPF
jgi:hypothetical protein